MPIILFLMPPPRSQVSYLMMRSFRTDTGVLACDLIHLVFCKSSAEDLCAIEKKKKGKMLSSLYSCERRVQMAPHLLRILIQATSQELSHGRRPNAVRIQFSRRVLGNQLNGSERFVLSIRWVACSAFEARHAEGPDVGFGIVELAVGDHFRRHPIGCSCEGGSLVVAVLQMRCDAEIAEHDATRRGEQDIGRYVF